MRSICLRRTSTPRATPSCRSRSLFRQSVTIGYSSFGFRPESGSRGEPSCHPARNPDPRSNSSEQGRQRPRSIHPIRLAAIILPKHKQTRIESKRAGRFSRAGKYLELCHVRQCNTSGRKNAGVRTDPRPRSAEAVPRWRS